MERIRAISFDLDETLWPLGRVVAEAEERLYAWLSEHHPEVTACFPPEGIQALKAEVARSHPHLQHDYSALRRITLAWAAQRSGGDPGLVEPAFEVFLEARQRVQPHRDVAPALARLRGRYRLATLTNGNADPHRAGLGVAFDCCLSPPAAGCAKPDPGIFHCLGDRLGVKPWEILHVGDDPECDVAGAAVAGLRTAWINREGLPWPGPGRPDLEIADLGALADRLLSR